MKRLSWQILLGVTMVLLSALLYAVQFAVVKDTRTVVTGLLANIAAQPIYILFVILLLQEWVNRRERRTILQKMNMVIGAFFSQTGTELIRRLARFDPAFDQLRSHLAVSKDWTTQSFRHASRVVKDFPLGAVSKAGGLQGLAQYLVQQQDFLLRLLENPNLLEHETFTQLLWAVSHLTEELAARRGFDGLPEADYQHLSNDMKRAYGLLLSEWLLYMRHLQLQYPYLFSLAVRMNPFDPNASPEIRA